jgi:transcriptional regulator with XRE-family HTH domain
MPFNNRILFSLREGCEMNRTIFSKRLGISRSYLYKLESGLQIPSLDIVERIAANTGLSLSRLIIPENLETALGDGPQSLYAESELRLELDNERSLRLEQAARLMDQDRRMVEAKMAGERYFAMICLYEEYVRILRDKGLSQAGRDEKIRGLARKAAKDGILEFNEILRMFGFTRSELKGVIGMTEYRCKKGEGFSVEARMPRGAALLLRCSVCEHRQHGECAGYGVCGNSPLGAEDLFKMLDASGFTSDEEKAKIITDYYYGLPVTAHDVAEAKYRFSRGRPAQRGLMYLEPTQRKGK